MLVERHRPNIFEFVDYRGFLRTYVQRKREKNPAWSYGTWARQLGLKSPSTLIMLINGQRNPGPKLVARLCRQLNFNSEAADYFKNLVQLHKVRDDVGQSMKLMKVIEERNPQRGFRILDLQSFTAISNWHYYAIRECIRLEDFREDPHWIAARLAGRISAAEARSAIETLLQLGLLARGVKGRLEITQRHFDTQTDVADEGLKRFHEGVLAQATHSLRRTAPARREISGGTIAIRESDLPRAKKLIRKFQMELCQLLESDSADSIYQIEVAFFPWTDPTDRGHA